MIDTSSLTAAVVGGALGLSFVLLNKKNEIEERCDFMLDAQEGLDQAFETADELLSAGQLPPAIRSMFLYLFSAYSNPEIGLEFANALTEPSRSSASQTENPLWEAMRGLLDTDTDLARRVHQSMTILAFSLMFMHLASHIRVEKVKSETAADPDSIWVRLWKSTGSGDDHHDAPGGVVHA